jgi:hypothetical protein
MQKLPITLAVLRRILPLLKGWPNPYRLSQDDFTFAMGSLMAVNQFLRGGEAFTTAKSDRKILTRSMVNIRWIHAAGKHVCALVTSVPQTKTQWEVAFVDVPCFSCLGADDFDPVGLWRIYVRRFKGPPGSPAFPMACGAAATRDFMVKRTVSLLALANIPSVNSLGRPVAVKAASWRAGAVRSAMEAGLSEVLIMEYGRWRSAAWKSYLTMTPLDLFGAAQRMSFASVAGTLGAQQVGVEMVAQLGASSDDAAKRRLDFRLQGRMVVARARA